MRAVNPDGTLGARVAPMVVAESDEDPALVRMVGSLRAARAANSVFLAVPSPTAAQVVEQVRALTRQMQGVIRLAANDLDGVE